MKEELLALASKLVEKALREGFSEAAAKITSSRRTMVKIANSEPSVIQYWDTLNVGLYLVRDKKILIVELEPSNVEELDKSIKELIGIADKITESPFYAPLPEPDRKPEPIPGLVDDNIVRVLDNPVELAEAVIETAHREKIDFTAGTIDLAYTEKALITSKNVELYEDSTMIQAYLRAFAGEDGSGQWALGSRRLDKKKLEEMASMAARYAVDSRGRVDIEPGVYDVILSPMVFGNLLDLVGWMSSAFSMFMGMSMFVKNKPGDKVASEKLTLIDDARNPELPGSTSFDDEGIPTYSKPIIENGVLKTILHNSKTATKVGVKTTGNAGWIMPMPWNLVVKPGTHSLEELIGEVKKGILITNNWYTRLQNYVEGLFSTITRDALFLVENGKITKPINKLRIADSLTRLLNNIEALGDKTYDIQWWEVRIPTRLPYVLIRQIHTSKHTV